MLLIIKVLKRIKNEETGLKQISEHREDGITSTTKKKEKEKFFRHFERLQNAMKEKKKENEEDAIPGQHARSSFVFRNYSVQGLLNPLCNRSSSSSFNGLFIDDEARVPSVGSQRRDYAI